MGFTVEEQRAHYDQFTQQTAYFFDTGLRQEAVQGPAGTSSEIVSVHAGLGQKVITLRAQRSGARIELPSPEPQSANEVLLRTVIRPAVVSLDAGGVPVVFCEIEYHYALVKPLTHLDPLPMGIAPYDDGAARGTPPVPYAIQPKDFTTRGVPVTQTLPSLPNDYSVYPPKTGRKRPTATGEPLS